MTLPINLSAPSSETGQQPQPPRLKFFLFTPQPKVLPRVRSFHPFFSTSPCSTSRKSCEVPGIHRTFCADDLIIYGQPGALAASGKIVHSQLSTQHWMQYLQPRGLICEPTESRLPVRSHTRGRDTNTTFDPQVSISDASIPKLPTLRILGVPFHQDGSGSPTTAMQDSHSAHTSHSSHPGLLI